MVCTVMTHAGDGICNIKVKSWHGMEDPHQQIPNTNRLLGFLYYDPFLNSPLPLSDIYG